MTLWHYWTNVLGFLKEIDQVKDQAEKQRLASEFVAGLSKEYTKDPNFVIKHFLEINSDVKLFAGPKNLMDALKESIFCYVNGQYLATIATTGIASELFCVHLYDVFLKNLKLTDLQVKKRLEAYGQISQQEKIDTLFAVVGIEESLCQILHTIRKLRNQNVHAHSEKDYKRDALLALKSLFGVINSYSEMVEKHEKK